MKKAIEQGAELLCGGHRIGTKGYFFEPTILTNCTQKMDIIQEETLDRYFRLLSLQRWKTPLPGLMIVNMG